VVKYPHFFYLPHQDDILLTMKLIVIRHGETDLNKDDRLQGSKGPNEGLNEHGREVVENLRNSLLLIPEIIYASPLRRTQETAHILNKRFDLGIVLADALIERDFGTLSGKLRSEVNPAIVEADLEGHYDYRPYGGESVDEVRARVENFIASLRAHKEELVMLVTHRGVIRILYDLYPDNTFPENITPGSKHVFDVS
jgi:broad specificity phosphatase PhoE